MLEVQGADGKNRTFREKNCTLKQEVGQAADLGPLRTSSDARIVKGERRPSKNVQLLQGGKRALGEEVLGGRWRPTGVPTRPAA